MPPREAPKTRTTPAITTTPTTSVTDEQLKRLIAQGVSDVLTELEATGSGNGEDNHDSGIGGRRQAPLARETVGHDVAYAMTWINLKKMMTDKMFLEESDKIQRYVGVLPDLIHRSVIASKPKTMQDAIEFETKLMDKKIRTFAERQSENKMKQDDNQ
ncbi:hypothetical protein Tco_0625398 [Tanacetum coccineum]|uniref:Reverse transcriptase domain-containing protein n=1 Tax=Tanacetum coccineum TaxID=301880 RepID=A0ABQ4WGN9_9ASTR